MIRQHSKNALLPVWAVALTDILLLAASLCVFALFHHVLPRKMAAQSEITPVASSALLISQPQEQAASESPRAKAPAKKGDGDAASKTGGRGQNGSNDQKGGSAVASGGGADISGVFTESVVKTETGYSDESASITINRRETGSGSDKVTYYVADIYINDITRLKTGFADDAYGRGLRDSLLDMDSRLNAVAALTGDYYGNTDAGVVIRNGVLYRNAATTADICILYADGTMKTLSYESFDADAEMAAGAWQAWTFGPSLLDENGNAFSSFTSSRQISAVNPRSAIGYYSPGHYCFVVVDGREQGYSLGLTLPKLAGLFEEMGCKSAYNLDGGKSAMMSYDDRLVNQPVGGGREISDCIYITEAAK